MIFQQQNTSDRRRNTLLSTTNPEESILSASRFNSPSLKLGRIRSWKFIYKSPTRVEQVKDDTPLTFNKQAHKLIVRKLPQFHEEILENDPLKKSKIIENINYFREQQKNKQGMGISQANTMEKSRVSNDQFEVSRMLVNLRNSKSPETLRMSRSLSCSYVRLDNSRMSVIDGLKTAGSQFFQSVIKQDGPLLQSRIIEARKSPSKVNMAESQYFGGIIGK